MQEIAEALRMQREALGLSIDDLFQRTRINPDYLRALEAGQFDVLPNTYARLFVKKFAQEVGLDDELILAQYDRHAPRPAPPPVAPPIHRQRNYQPLLFTAVGVFIVSLISKDASKAEIGYMIGYTIGGVLSILATGRLIELVQRISDKICAEDGDE